MRLFREESGPAGLSGRDLPTAEALAANAQVVARAQLYKDSGAFPGERLGRLQGVAYLDLLNGIAAEDRIAAGALPGDMPDPEDGPDDNGPDDTPGPDDGQPGPAPGLQAPGNALVRPPDLILPLATLLGLAERPGEAHGLGPLDPGLCRALADAASASSHTRWCLTVTDENGIAIGRGRQATTQPRHSPTGRRGKSAGTVARPRQPHHRRQPPRCLGRQSGPPGQVGWSFTRERDPGPPGGHGRWTITLPAGRELTVDLEPMPTFACDHRHESRAYQPNDKLRHLVQVRDYECTFPMCNRHARDCDFEHAVPYDQGGRTCACNAGARSRAWLLAPVAGPRRARLRSGF